MIVKEKKHPIHELTKSEQRGQFIPSRDELYYKLFGLVDWFINDGLKPSHSNLVEPICFLVKEIQKIEKMLEDLVTEVEDNFFPRVYSLELITHKYKGDLLARKIFPILFGSPRFAAVKVFWYFINLRYERLHDSITSIMDYAQKSIKLLEKQTNCSIRINELELLRKNLRLCGKRIGYSSYENHQTQT